MIALLQALWAAGGTVVSSLTTKGLVLFLANPYILVACFFTKKRKKYIMFCVCNCFSTEWFYFHPSLGNFLRHLLSRLGKGSVLLTADRKLPSPHHQQRMIWSTMSTVLELRKPALCS